MFKYLVHLIIRLVFKVDYYKEWKTSPLLELTTLSDILSIQSYNTLVSVAGNFKHSCHVGHAIYTCTLTPLDWSLNKV